MPVDDRPHACVDEDLRAEHARLVRAVRRRAVDRGAVRCALDDRILLGVDPAAKLVLCSRRDAALLAQATHLITVRETCGHAIVAGREDAFVLDENRTDVAPHARGPPRHLLGDSHEVLVPRWSGHIRTPLAGSLLLGAEQAIARIAETGHDVAVIVQVAIDRAYVDRDVLARAADLV